MTISLPPSFPPSRGTRFVFKEKRIGSDRINLPVCVVDVADKRAGGSKLAHGKKDEDKDEDAVRFA